MQEANETMCCKSYNKIETIKKKILMFAGIFIKKSSAEFRNGWRDDAYF